MRAGGCSARWYPTEGPRPWAACRLLEPIQQTAESILVGKLGVPQASWGCMHTDCFVVVVAAAWCASSGGCRAPTSPSPPAHLPSLAHAAGRPGAGNGALPVCRGLLPAAHHCNDAPRGGGTCSRQRPGGCGLPVAGHCAAVSTCAHACMLPAGVMPAHSASTPAPPTACAGLACHGARHVGGAADGRSAAGGRMGQGPRHCAM